jgi:hypothetical protein
VKQDFFVGGVGKGPQPVVADDEAAADADEVVVRLVPVLGVGFARGENFFGAEDENVPVRVFSGRRAGFARPKSGENVGTILPLAPGRDDVDGAGMSQEAFPCKGQEENTSLHWRTTRRRCPRKTLCKFVPPGRKSDVSFGGKLRRLTRQTVAVLSTSQDFRLN